MPGTTPAPRAGKGSPRPLRAALKLALIVIERYGLDGKPPRSIAEVAQSYGLTREEVRLIEARLLKAIRVLVQHAQWGVER